MPHVSKSVLRAKMFEYFRQLEEGGGELIVTEFGKPVLRITPYAAKCNVDELFKEVRGKAKIPRAAALESAVAEFQLGEALAKRAYQCTGIDGRAALIKAGLETFTAQRSSRDLAKLGGAEPSLKAVRRRRVG